MINEIPIKTLITDSLHVSGHFLAKSGLSFYNSEKNRTDVFGFGFSEDKEKAINSSKFELYERLYANYNLYNFEKPIFLGQSFSDLEKKKEFSAHDIFLGSYSNDGTKSVDANGLGCHYLLEHAVKHAVLEVVERHLLAQIWYGNCQMYEIINANFIFDSSWKIRCYCTNNTSVPMAIVTVDNLEKGIWVLGSALRWPFDQAIEHAKNEAFMLLESSLSEKGYAYSKEIDERLFSLKDPIISNLRNTYFNSKVLDKIEKPKCDEALDIILKKTIGMEALWIFPLHASQNINVVRAISESAQNPRWFRSKKNLTPPDPFC